MRTRTPLSTSLMRALIVALALAFMVCAGAICLGRGTPGLCGGRPPAPEVHMLGTLP